MSATASIATSHCKCCGSTFDTADRDKYYSVTVDGTGYLTDIVEGKLVPGAFHYCSDMCMFKRDHGVVTKVSFFTQDIFSPEIYREEAPAI